MRVTEKGQVTIPKEIRDRLGIGPGSEIDFVEDGNSVRIVAANAGQFDAEAFRRTLDSLAGTVDLGGMTTDEYMLWLRGPRDDLDAH
jgi:AbrB family looped-hinge helix DNA binding protein